MAVTLDQNDSLLYVKPSSSVASTPRRSNSTKRENNKNVKNVFKVDPPLTRKAFEKEETEEEKSEGGSVTSSSATICGSKAKIHSKNYVKEVVSAINAGHKKQEVDMFKNRLDDIQKRRVRRQIDQRENQKVKTSPVLQRYQPQNKK